MSLQRLHVLLAVLTLVLVPIPVPAQEALSLAEAEALAVREDPGREALEAQARAMAEREIAAGEWPDPQLRIGFANVPVDTFSVRQDPMTQTVIGLRQPIPNGAMLEARQAGMRAMVGEFEAERTARALRVVRTVRELWLEIVYWTETERTIQDTRELFGSLVDVTRSRYAVGRSNQHDIIRAELELDRLDERALDARQRAEELRAALAEWLGPRATGPLQRLQLDRGEVPAREILVHRISSHPVVEARSARLAATEANVGVANARYRPSWAVELNYGLRRGSNPDGSNRSDVATFMVSLDMPLFTADRQDRERSAARSERAAARAERVDVIRQLTAELERALTIWSRTTERLQVYDDVLLRQTDLQAQAALSAYGAGVGDFADLMRANVAVLNIQLERIRLATDRQRAWVVIDYLGGLDDA